MKRIAGWAIHLAFSESGIGVEVKNLRWQDVDLFGRTKTIRCSKNLTSHRVIPLNQSAKDVFLKIYKRAEVLGLADPGHYVWPASQ
jgi:hypothetical protein